MDLGKKTNLQALFDSYPGVQLGEKMQLNTGTCTKITLHSQVAIISKPKIESILSIIQTNFHRTTHF